MSKKLGTYLLCMSTLALVGCAGSPPRSAQRPMTTSRPMASNTAAPRPSQFSDGPAPNFPQTQRPIASTNPYPTTTTTSTTTTPQLGSTSNSPMLPNSSSFNSGIPNAPMGPTSGNAVTPAGAQVPATTTSGPAPVQSLDGMSSFSNGR